MELSRRPAFAARCGLLILPAAGYDRRPRILPRAGLAHRPASARPPRRARARHLRRLSDARQERRGSTTDRRSHKILPRSGLARRALDHDRREDATPGIRRGAGNRRANCRLRDASRCDERTWRIATDDRSTTGRSNGALRTDGRIAGCQARIVRGLRVPRSVSGCARRTQHSDDPRSESTQRSTRSCGTRIRTHHRSSDNVPRATATVEEKSHGHR